MSEEPVTPDVIVVPTNEPGKVEAEYTAQGWFVCDLYAKPFHRELCGDFQWAIKFWRPAKPKQVELL